MALLAGLFLIPAVLLWLGHGFRFRPRRWRWSFWGGVVGQVTGVALTATVMVLPPVAWHDGGWRGFLVHWSLLLPVLGGMAAGYAGAHLRASED